MLVSNPASFGKLTPRAETPESCGFKTTSETKSKTCLLWRPPFPFDKVLDATLRAVRNRQKRPALACGGTGLHSTGVVLYSALSEKRSTLHLPPTFLILRLMIDSAANTLSPTADSSMFTPVLLPVSWVLLRQLSPPLPPSSPSHSKFPTDHNTPETRMDVSAVFYGVAKKPLSVEPVGELPLVEPLLRARVSK